MYLSVTEIAVEVHSAVEELTVDMPEELASGKHSLFHLFTPSKIWLQSLIYLLQKTGKITR